jgi:hypothetical protein
MLNKEGVARGTITSNKERYVKNIEQGMPSKEC